MRHDSRFLRNKDLIEQRKLDMIGIVGLGGIGSFLIQSLAIMGWRDLFGWDNDVIEAHNLSSTAYPVKSVGDDKKDAAKELFANYSEGWQGIATAGNFTDENIPYPKQIVCTDNMESRKLVYEKWKKQLEKRHPRELFKDSFFIDLRMGATSVEMITVTPNNDNYMDHWLPSHDIPPAPCSMKHTVFAAQYIAALGLSQVYNLVAGLAFYDYIWTSLNPNMVKFGTLIIPKTEEVLNDRSEESKHRLDGDAIRTDLSHYRSA